MEDRTSQSKSLVQKTTHPSVWIVAETRTRAIQPMQRRATCLSRSIESVVFETTLPFTPTSLNSRNVCSGFQNEGRASTHKGECPLPYKLSRIPIRLLCAHHVGAGHSFTIRSLEMNWDRIEGKWKQSVGK